MKIEEATKEELTWLLVELMECTPIGLKEIEKRLEKIRTLFRKEEKTDP